MAGDLVNRGADRNDWDMFFAEAKGVFSHKPLIPALGNHEYSRRGKDDRLLYQDLFALPDASPVGEKAYTLRYGNVLLIVLDSDLPPGTQKEWLEQQLRETDATWKFAVYHHPSYSSKPNRNNPEIREIWGDIFDEYHVDLALQGHDHAYLRTYPMKGGKRTESPDDGTIYVVSVSGTKYYDQGDHDFTEAGFKNMSTYQVIDIYLNGDRLVFRAFDMEGKVRDEFAIDK
jgi:hypothetical protein